MSFSLSSLAVRVGERVYKAPAPVSKRFPNDESKTRKTGTTGNWEGLAAMDRYPPLRSALTGVPPSLG